MKIPALASALLLIFSANVYAGCENGVCTRDVYSSPAFQQAQAGFSARTCTGPSCGKPVSTTSSSSKDLGKVATVSGEEAPGTKAFADAPPAPSAKKSPCASGQCPLPKSGAAAKAGGGCGTSKCSGGGSSNAAKAAKAAGKACKSCGSSGGLFGIFGAIAKAVGSLFGLA